LLVGLATPPFLVQDSLSLLMAAFGYSVHYEMLWNLVARFGVSYWRRRTRHVIVAPRLACGL
jgi:hypothetical protein